MPLRISHADAGFDAAVQKLLAARETLSGHVSARVQEIIASVRAEGDAALVEFTRELDGYSVNADCLRFSKDEIAKYAAQCPDSVKAALRHAADRVRSFYEKQRPENMLYQDAEGVSLGVRWTAMSDVGVYVPGGTASYPSSVLMNALPAKVAGVKRLVMMVPCPRGEVNPAVIAAAEIAGVDEIYRIGGAQAVAALAYGTSHIAPVHKIVGPGNAYVAEAKRQVFGAVGIDMIAGPSEILVVADNKNNPDWIAADLLSQAEHDKLAQAILITDDAIFADAVAHAVEQAIRQLPRAEIAATAWRDYGAILVVDSLNDVPLLVDRIAPEHLELAIENPSAFAEKITHAGAIFLGRYTPEAIGDYIAGPSHVLPTSRTARFSSGLSVIDFMKRTSLIGCSEASLAKLAPDAICLAEAEGLHAHALSIAIRGRKG